MDGKLYRVTAPYNYGSTAIYSTTCHII